jgi:diguanylate cyclase (GGDEF)-like protein
MPGIARTVTSSFRLVIAGSVVMTLLLGGLLGWLMTSSRPAVARFERGLEAVDDQRAAMLDQETGLRGFLITGQKSYLGPYRTGVADLQVADQTLLSVATTPRLTKSLITLRLAEQRWVDDWAHPASAGHLRFAAGSQASNLFLAQGKTSFDEYRVEEANTDHLIVGKLAHLRAVQVTVLVGIAAGALLVAISASVIAVRLRTRLQRRILTPVGVLLSGLQAVREGDLQRRLPTEGPVELTQVITGFNEMTCSLSTAAERADVSELRIVDQARQLRAVLGMVREIGGSLNSGYVLAAITNGAMAISGASRAVVWLQDGTNTDSLARVWDSAPGKPSHAGRTEADEAGGNDAHVQTAAKFGRTTEGRANDGTADRLAVPLIVGAQVIGVLELILPSDAPLSNELVDVVETLSIHAATAIEATRLHEGTTHASEHDALTGLANRRRLEIDLAAECDRSLRYGNDLSFIMLDLDHFKRLNDTYGHQRGDEALQGSARAIVETLRTTDSAYRYGGEELAVIARETNLEGATQLAERIRVSIEHRYPGTGNAIELTASFGVAALPDHAATPEGLIACADAALYAAKEGGRNQVVQAVNTAPDSPPRKMGRAAEATRPTHRAR